MTLYSLPVFSCVPLYRRKRTYAPGKTWRGSLAKMSAQTLFGANLPSVNLPSRIEAKISSLDISGDPSRADLICAAKSAISFGRKSSGYWSGHTSSSNARSPLLIRISCFSDSVSFRLLSDSRQNAVPSVNSTRRSSTKYTRHLMIKSGLPLELITSSRFVANRPAGQ